MEIDWYTGPREQLRALFELAEDSQQQLDRYISLGRVLVARQGPRILGHLQLVPTVRFRQIELKNMTIVPQERGIGVGRALVEAAIQSGAAEDWTTDPIVINGIPLLDRVWLDLDLSGES